MREQQPRHFMPPIKFFAILTDMQHVKAVQYSPDIFGNAIPICRRLTLPKQEGLKESNSAQAQIVQKLNPSKWEYLGDVLLV